MIRQSKRNVQVQCSRIDAALNPIIEFTAFSVYIQVFWGNDDVRDPLFSVRNQKSAVSCSLKSYQNNKFLPVSGFITYPKLLTKLGLVFLLLIFEILLAGPLQSL